MITGRAYINYNSSDTKPQSYSLWFENKHHVEPNFTEHGTYNNDSKNCLQFNYSKTSSNINYLIKLFYCPKYSK